MDSTSIIAFVSDLPGAHVVTASEANGAPEVAWGDSFCYANPDDQRMPFATIVTHDYAGFDTTSNLNRPNVFRLNIAVGRQVLDELVGYPPADDVDYTALDRLLPHPVYAKQGWISILNPGPATEEQARALLVDAHARAVSRRRP
ncbi:MAG TPA: DUF6194 family protein [Pseudonocardiaceae bacterium]|nr:DUF6194 family protein [Pseudonocardiaceae bacterium]